MTVVLARQRHVHAFAFRWGVTVRVRRRDHWTHLSVRAQRNGWRHDPARSSLQFEVVSWKTAPGTYNRVAGSKRYVRLKVAI